MLLHLGATDDLWLLVGDISGGWQEMFPVCKIMTHTWRTFFIDWATQPVSDAIQLFLQRWWRHKGRQHYVMSRTCSCLFFSSTPYVSSADRLARHRSPADRTPLSIWPNTIDVTSSFHRTMDISSSCNVMSSLWFNVMMDRFQELITRHRLTKSQIAVRKIDGDPSTTGADETSPGSSRTSSLRSPTRWPWPASYQHITCKRQREGWKDKARYAKHYIWGYKTTGVTWRIHREDETRETRKLHSKLIVNWYST